jgi:polyisoprenyl-phosphate glycosyltransferase
MYSIVIPAYNEEGSISKTVSLIQEVMESNGLTPFELTVVDDGSHDRTGKLAEKAGAKVISNLNNMGYGFSLKRGITDGQYDTVIIIDADGTYPIEKIPTLVVEYNHGYDMVVGARTGKHYWEGFIKTIMRIILKFLVEFTTGKSISDINSGFRIFSRKSAIPLFAHLSNTFSFTTSITLFFILSKRFIKYIPVPYHQRVGKTKVRLLPDALRTLQFIIEAILFSNPIKLFLLISTVPFLIGLIITGVSFFTSTALFGYALNAFLIAILIFSFGLLAELFRKTQRGPTD